MPRFWTLVACCTVCVLPLAGVADLSAQAIGLGETLLPETTQGFFAISNVDTLKERWNNTQLGHLMADPVMEPFRKDLRRQFEDRWSTVHERLGLTLDDMKGVPGGDVAIALIAPAPGKAALAIVIDVTGKLPEAQEMLKKVTAAQLERGAKRTEVNLNGCPDPVIQFDLPEPEEEREAGKSTLKGSAKSEVDKAAAAASDKAATAARDKATTAARAPDDVAVRQAFYCLTGNLLAVTDNAEVMAGILGRAMGREGHSLADHKPFQIVMQRCKSDHHDDAPQARWYIHPLGYAEAARASTPESKRRKGKSILEVMRNQGVGAVLGVGGFVDFSSEGYELVHRTAVYAPPPYEKSMKMLVLPNLLSPGDFAPQSWVPRDIATYTTLYFDILNAFDNFGPLFEELVAQGEEGTWKEVLEGLNKDPTGPQIDLRAELIEHLGRRVSMLTDYQLPITTSSERLLFAIEAKEPKAVAKGIEKLMKNDPTVKQRDVDGHVVWEFVEDEATPGIEPIDIDFGAAPHVAPAHPFRKKKADAEEEEEEKETRFLPHAAITVWEENLLIASHIDFLRKIIAPADKPEPLGDDIDYLLIDGEVKKFDPKEKCARLFSRTDEEYRPTYELVRQNKLPQSETMLARVLNALFGEGKKGVPRAQKFDGSQLPEYQVVRRYLGPAGLQATSEPNGWFLKGCTLTK